MSELIDTLVDEVLAGLIGPPPTTMAVTSVFWLSHGSRLAGSDTSYRNHYVVARVGPSFGACSITVDAIDPATCHSASGSAVDVLLRDKTQPLLQFAVLDAYLAAIRPHRDDPDAEPVTLPAGTPEQRAHARDAAIADLLDIAPGAKVALIGVVNPLVAAIRERGGECLPCDLTLRTTQWGDRIAESSDEVLDAADVVVATGMTLANNTFDRILARCRARGVPLILYAQTGSAVARTFLGAGVTALSAEPFPFSQFSADPTQLYRYRASAP